MSVSLELKMTTTSDKSETGNVSTASFWRFGNDWVYRLYFFNQTLICITFFSAYFILKVKLQILNLYIGRNRLISF